MGVDHCFGCEIIENPKYSNPKSIDFVTCRICPCYGCPHVHDCEWQCGKQEDGGGKEVKE